MVYNISFLPRYGKIREIQTQDIDTTKTLHIQFAFTSGRRNCGGGGTAENPILLQFSLDKGITWNRLQLLREPSAIVENYHIVIPPRSKIFTNKVQNMAAICCSR